MFAGVRNPSANRGRIDAHRPSLDTRCGNCLLPHGSFAYSSLVSSLFLVSLGPNPVSLLREQAETIWRQVLALTREHHPRFTMHRGVFCYAFAELLLASGRLDEAAQLIHESEQHLRGAGATTGRYWDRFESVRNQLSDALGAAAPQ